MTHVVTENCIKCKHTDCVEVCPVDCFHEGPNFLVIDPDECIDCTLCVAECPVEAIFAEDDVRDVVESVAGVLGCEKIRTRGAVDHVFMDLHVWVDGSTPLSHAHDISHVVKDNLLGRFPQLADVVIHIEPPPIDGGLPRRRY